MKEFVQFVDINVRYFAEINHI